MRQKKIKEATFENILALGVMNTPSSLNFSQQKSIFIEIGSGKGQFITTLAKEDAEHIYIAVEKEQNVCYRLAQKKNQLKLENLYIIMDDADHLGPYLNGLKAEIIQLNFSDPWPKKRHHKRRLSYPAKLALYKSFLKEEGQIILRTDHVDLFNDSYQYFLDAGFEIVECNWNLEASNYMTEYEEKKRQLGPIYQLSARVKK